MTRRYGTRSSAASHSSLVLIVEDDRETRSFYRTALAGGGFRVAEAHNGFQALEKATEHRPDLILTDIAVPGLDGIELCRRLRADARTRDIPLLAITGYADRQYEDRARAAGADRVLIKPCSDEVLVAEARALIALPVKSGSRR
jgi:two-component system cell cycle response regulator DivK